MVVHVGRSFTLRHNSKPCKQLCLYKASLGRIWHAQQPNLDVPPVTHASYLFTSVKTTASGDGERSLLVGFEVTSHPPIIRKFPNGVEKYVRYTEAQKQFT